MNVIQEIERITDAELKSGIYGGLSKGSWHDKYSNSAWVYLGGFSYELSEGDLICVMSQWGEIEDINLIRDKTTGKSQGFAFVKYEDQRSTILAVDNFNGIKLLGRVLRCDHVDKYKLPKDIREAEAEKLADNPDDKVEIGPGHAYKGMELENDHDISKGVDLWNVNSSSSSSKAEQGTKTDDIDAVKKSKKDKKDKKKHKKEHKEHKSSKHRDSEEDASYDSRDDKDRSSSKRKYREDSEDDRRKNTSDKYSERRSREDSRDRRNRRSNSRDRNRDRDRDRGSDKKRDNDSERRRDNVGDDKSSGAVEYPVYASSHNNHRTFGGSASVGAYKGPMLPPGEAPMASWRGKRDPTLITTSYPSNKFGNKPSGGPPVADSLPEKRGEFAGFGGMNRLR